MQISKEKLLAWLKPAPGTTSEVRSAEAIPAGEYEIYHEKLNIILDEAREVFVRTGVSGMLHSGDLIVGIYTPRGDMITASCGTYLHAVAAQLPVKYLVRNVLSMDSIGVNDGDVFYCNEARIGGIHNPDQMAIMPVYHDDELIAWTVAAVHQPETGATEPGGMPVTARSRFDEGMHLLPIKVVEGFRLREDLLEMMANMVSRAPRMQMIDTRARIVACDRIRVRVVELAESKGSDFLSGLFRRMIDEGEEGARRRIRLWNDGTYRSVAFLDTIGHTQTLIRVRLALRKRGDSIVFDFTGTSPENDGSFNAYPHIVAAHCAVYLYAYAFSDLPISAGTYAPLEFVVPDGTYLSAGMDAAVSNSPPACIPVVSVTNIAFSKMVFDSPDRARVTSPAGNGTSGVMYSGVTQWGTRLSDMSGYTLNTAGGGARAQRDGVDAYGFPLGHYGKAPDLEDVENEFPLLHLFQKLRQDSAGLGRYRGGAGTETAWLVHLTDRFIFQSVASHSQIPSSSGIFGGYPPAVRPGIRLLGTDIPNRMHDGSETPMGTEELLADQGKQSDSWVGSGVRASRAYERGDVFVGLSPGGAGYGDVLDRDPQRVMDDLRRQLISPWVAAHVCKVAFDPETLVIDTDETERLRDGERRARIARGVPFEEFQAAWADLSPPAEALEYFGAWPSGEKVREILRI